ncbi:MAG: hypothetical protein GY711_20590 [bacterium]|nr:hypothetical protein [bacterium]
MQRGLLSVLVAIFGVSSGAFARQAINLDAGDPAAPIPAETFGAAAGQVGTWNAFGNPLGTSPHTLSDPIDAVTGLPATGVEITIDTYVANFTFDNPGTAGDDEALMDDLFDLGAGAARVTISGLADGDYEIYTYAWAPDSATFSTIVDVAPSADPAQSIGGAWPGGYALGVTHALHTASVSAGGQIDIDLTTPDIGSLGGIQIVPVASDPIGTNYCGPAVPNSTGVPGVISAFGSTVVADQNVQIVADQLPAGLFGYFLVSRTQGMSTPMGSVGVLCLDGDIGRYDDPPQIFSGPTGQLAIDLTAIPTSTPGSQVVLPGETLNFQCWHRDAPLPGGSNFTDAVSILFQ